jgi:membrane protease YdiL (CAAX protease family)
MNGRKTDSVILIAPPLWQVLLVLVGLPAAYLANSLMPWSIGLFQRHDHAFFWKFWASISVLHWGSVALVVILLKRAGRGLVDIGLALSPLKVAAMVGFPVVVGLALTFVREDSHGPPSAPQLPATAGERLFWIFVSVTAGFCEELIYRGFSIRALEGRALGTWLAVAVATLAFFFMHGPAIVIARATVLSSFLILYPLGLLFSALFLWRRSLVPGICLHALIDVANIGGS